MSLIIDPNDDGRPKELPYLNSTKAKGELVGFKVLCKRWSQVRDIISEAGNDATYTIDLLVRALEQGHGIKVPHNPDRKSMQENPFLFFIYSEEQKELLAKNGIPEPTFMQILSTCEVIDTNEAKAVQRYRELKGDPRA